jgi:hypothetical protein
MSLANYEEVPDRIKRFFEKHPEGSLRCQKIEYKVLPVMRKQEQANEETILVPDRSLHVIYHALAYRTPDDKAPGYGVASEPIPGLTNYTRDSELMNAETSAWGRALVALGFVAKTVASANEVRARSGSDFPSRRSGEYNAKADNRKEATKPQKGRVRAEATKAGVKADSQEWMAFTKREFGQPVNVDKLTFDQASYLIDRLPKGAIPTGESDVPADNGFEHEKPPQDETLPFS